MPSETDVRRLMPGGSAHRQLQPERPLLVQVRVSQTEKNQLINLARQEGFETISSYARARLLGQPGPRSVA